LAEPTQICQHLSCTGKPKTGPGTLDAAVQALNREESVPLTCWLCYY